VGAFEARAKRAGRLRRLVVPAAAALVLQAAGLGGWAAWRRRPDTEGLRLATEAAARLALDDSASLSRALQLYDALLARSPSRHDAEASRALTRLLMASAQQEEADPFGEQLAANAADRERLLREHPPGSEDALRTLTVEASRLEAELAPRRKAAEALAGQAAGELRTLAAGPDGEALAARGQIVAAALAGDRAEVARLAPLARSAGPAPWADLAEAWLEVRPDGNRQQAVARLTELIRARPELLRARFLLARAQVGTGHRDEALATLTALLAANPRHERAQRLKAMLSAAPPPQPVAAAPQPAPPPPRPVARPAPVPAPTPPAAAALSAPAEPAKGSEPEPEQVPAAAQAPQPEPVPIPAPPPARPRPAPPPEPPEPSGG
jgi:hypothetical protein